MHRHEYTRICAQLYNYPLCKSGKIDALNYLINELGVDPIAIDEHQKCTVHAATQANQLETVQVQV